MSTCTADDPDGDFGLADGGRRRRLFDTAKSFTDHIPDQIQAEYGIR